MGFEKSTLNINQANLSPILTSKNMELAKETGEIHTLRY